MIVAIADTHTTIWYLFSDPRLGKAASAFIGGTILKGDHIGVSSISIVEMIYLIKKLAERAGLDPTKYAGHSLRAGHATSAAITETSERSIMNQTGHRSVQMVRRYIRDGNLFRDNSAAKLGCNCC
ncbi:MAG TPA: tyrosine-type recombinase/integrase [Bryobacteraceae bacterium]